MSCSDVRSWRLHAESIASMTGIGKLSSAREVWLMPDDEIHDGLSIVRQPWQLAKCGGGACR